MEQLILHMIGDYTLQSKWIANTKTKNNVDGYFACLIHCLIYSSLFYQIASFSAIIVIFSTHYLIDKFRLAKYLTMFINGDRENNGYGNDTPLYLSTWLLFINDNIIHIVINYFAIKYL